MTWTKALVALSFLFATATVWACGDDDTATSSSSSNPCPKDDPATAPDEAECKEAATVQAGEEAITKRGCKNCHGEDMAGADKPLAGKTEYEKTVIGLPVKLYPPNLTSDPTGLGNWKEDAIVYAIRVGIDDESQSLCPQMEHFSNMSDFEVYSIVKYLRSIPPVSKKVPRSVCPPTKLEGQQ